MNVKEKVLEALELNRGQFISGEALSQSLGVSRQYVWKAVKSLTADGYEITSSTNRGYRLSGKCDKLSSAVISSLTGGRAYCFDSVSSTNLTAKELYLSVGDCVVAAEKQTGGVKKDGSPFPSPQACGVYMTAALTADFPATDLRAFRGKCAQAVKAAIERACGESARLCNVDDVYVNDKKVCGILCECVINAATERAECAFIGVGIYTRESEIIGKVLGHINSGQPRNELIADVFNCLKTI